MNKEELLKEYETTFGEKGKNVFFSPGRINVIGEHTDYNGGHVFPAAISLGVYGVYGPERIKKFACFLAMLMAISWNSILTTQLLRKMIAFGLTTSRA